ncbi:MAG: MBL fold metallo-hydrolase [Rickettsiales bacterium]|nr:MAG: MBL fold metallo-hydrolase [Rickettsiales bacterium]
MQMAKKFNHFKNKNKHKSYDGFTEYSDNKEKRERRSKWKEHKKRNRDKYDNENQNKEKLRDYKKLSTIEKLKYNVAKNIFGGTPKTYIEGIKITFLGGAKSVTGSKYLLETHRTKVMIDCGLFQGERELRRRNWNDLPINPKNVDAIILTHAHLDHSGYIPLLVKNGFKGKIYCTPPTFDVVKLILADSGFLQEEEARYAAKKGYSKHIIPKALYTQKDAVKCFSQFYMIDFHKEVKIDDEISFSFTRAGHIIGAESVLVKAQTGKKILFSGDLGRSYSPVVCSPEPVPQADFVLVESTYGNRTHPENTTAEFLSNIINKTASKGGKIIIPAFAVGRTQKILYHINKLKKEGKIPNITIFLDSPMSIKVTSMVDHFVAEKKMTREQYKELYNNVKMCVTKIDSKKILTYSSPAIIISASGMLAGGRVLHHLANFGPMPNCTILLVGYQAAGTRGRDLQEGKKEVKIHGEIVPIRAKIETLGNMSDHADQNELIDWLKTMPKPPEKVYIVHGEIEQEIAFAKKIEETLGWKTEIPDYLDVEKLL